MGTAGARRRPVLELSILSRLSPGLDERYAIAAADIPGLERALSRAVRGPRAVAEIYRGLEVIAMLELELESPSAAQLVIDLMRRNAEVVSLLTAAQPTG